MRFLPGGNIPKSAIRLRFRVDMKGICGIRDGGELWSPSMAVYYW